MPVPALQTVPRFSTSQPLAGAGTFSVAARAAPAEGDGLVEGDCKMAEVVQRPNTLSKSVFCL